jgi:hypothetical protein
VTTGTKQSYNLGFGRRHAGPFYDTCFGRIRTKRPKASPATEYDDQENDGPAPQAHLSELPEFLPGIIIQGHDWNLVITTQEKEKTILWQKIPMGSTSNTKGVYQITCCLQLLRQWAQDTVWPWLKEIIRQSSKPSLS